MPGLGTQFATLLLLAIPVASVTWTFTHEELFREPRDWLTARSESSRSVVARKFFYVLTCEYCFSHYVAIAFLALTGVTVLFTDWRGSLLAWLSVVWIANVYMSFFGRLRLDIKRERTQIEALEEVVEQADSAPESPTKRLRREK